ncbi:hypothetical protein CPT_Menos_032 [Burkholderia phage Menos]|uniref:Uncharacterized protein n=1 Tax=Burkholderia phage Menos TaxID=2924900 RepID=A0AAE9K645_9CAUD|nr:hypothetical protein CPT_Menos_032 [Burkholderia phage Menos]
MRAPQFTSGQNENEGWREAGARRYGSARAPCSKSSDCAARRIVRARRARWTSAGRIRACPTGCRVAIGAGLWR